MTTDPARDCPPVCSFAGCGRKREARGLCHGHFEQQRSGRELRDLGTRPRRKLIQNASATGTMIVPLTRGKVAVVDDVDAEEVGRWNWHAIRINDKWYAQTQTSGPRPERRRFCLHELVAKLSNKDSEAEVDHENGDGLDCRRSNLRAASASQNQWNKRMQRNNTTGVKGVTLCRRSGRFRASVKANYLTHDLGTFDTLAEAAERVAAKRVELHGAFANHGRSAK